MRKRPALIVVAALLLAAMTVVTSSRGGLALFSPHSLAYQTQSERTIFGTGIPIYRSARKPTDNALIAMLVNEKFVSPAAGASDRLETVFHRNDLWRDGDGPLYGVMHRYREQIIRWSREHRDCAELYWAEVFRLIRSDDRVDQLTGYEILNRCWRITDLETMQETIRRLKIDVKSLMAT